VGSGGVSDERREPGQVAAEHVFYGTLSTRGARGAHILRDFILPGRRRSRILRDLSSQGR
jgi:hypothetical protein